MNEEPATSNRRRSTRAEVEGCALLHVPGGAMVRCRLADVGLGGVRLIERCDATRVDAGVEVTLELECAGAGWVVQRGRVIRHDRGQIAVVFDALAPEVARLIEDEVLGALEAQVVPRVVVVDRAAGRRRHVAGLVRAAGCCPIEVATPLEAVATVERSRNHVRAVVVAETLTQTQATELEEFLADEHPCVRVVRIADDDTPVRELLVGL